ncbi:hypothetical protein HY628_01135 [Candidatus Uhrbacteria bacterium]|nr:hypothetical protein [Candidatus Uhrbacteria bacterium]
MVFEGRYQRFEGILGKGILFFLLFAAYAFLPFRAPKTVWNSPDEMANAFWAHQVAEERTLMVWEPLEEQGRGRIHPRSITVRDSFLVPQSFHGLPVIYGWIAFVLGNWILPFLTPFFAALAVLAWRSVVASAFGHRAGLIAASLLAITPAWWYYANRGLYHNVFFVSLLIFSAYFFLMKPSPPSQSFNKNSIAQSLNRSIAFPHLTSGLLLGFALWVRPSEIGWIGLGLVFLFLTLPKQLTLKKMGGFLIGLVLGILPLLTINYGLYGNPLASGYPSLTDGTPLAGEETAPNLITQSLDYSIAFLFPFGLHPRAALTHFSQFFILLPWGITLLLGISFLWLAYRFLAGQGDRKEVILALLWFGLTGWLVLFYGSWLVRDNPDPSAVTVGSSYLRYWLPSFILGTIAIGAFGAALWQRFGRGGMIVLATLGAILLGLNFTVVFSTPGDGLFSVRQTLERYAKIKSEVLRMTPLDSVIIVDRADKIFFPDRRVVTPLRDPATYEIVPALIKSVPLYYFGLTMKPEDKQFHQQTYWGPNNLSFGRITTFEHESLYKFLR